MSLRSRHKIQSKSFKPHINYNSKNFNFLKIDFKANKTGIQFLRNKNRFKLFAKSLFDIIF